MILILDNNNSSTYTLVHLLQEAGEVVKIISNNHFSINEIHQLAPDALIIVSSHAHLDEANIYLKIINKFGPRLPILGIGLGYLTIGYSYGAIIKSNSRIMHGKVSNIYHDGKGVYANLPNPFPATRYDSLVIDKGSLPPYLQAVSCSEQGEVMGIRHVYYPVEGVQFHPESIMSFQGDKIIKNFLSLKNRGLHKPGLFRFYK